MAFSSCRTKRGLTKVSSDLSYLSLNFQKLSRSPASPCVEASYTIHCTVAHWYSAYNVHVFLSRAYIYSLCFVVYQVSRRSSIYITNSVVAYSDCIYVMCIMSDLIDASGCTSMRIAAMKKPHSVQASLT